MKNWKKISISGFSDPSREVRKIVRFHITYMEWITGKVARVELLVRGAPHSVWIFSR